MTLAQAKVLGVDGATIILDGACIEASTTLKKHRLHGNAKDFSASKDLIDCFQPCATKKNCGLLDLINGKMKFSKLMLSNL